MSLSCIPPGNSGFTILDFQGFALDLTSTFGPVVTQSLDTPAPPNQLWELVLVNHDGLVLASGLSQAAGQAIVLSEEPNGEVVGATNTGIAFNVTCLPNGSVNLVEDVLGVALTASQVEDPTSSAPVTLETFTGSEEQVWSLVSTSPLVSTAVSDPSLAPCVIM
ncbi:hypothetical protein B0H12DRAFT_1230892 [Mycena haematopus]|nr:hypothetical protein B0H12DRAFT_1230892 [Mycena haematopus]